MSTLLAPILQYFFTEHLTSHKQVSPRTIVAYRDSFRLLLQFLKKKTGKQPSTLCVIDLDAPVILAFLESLEEQRNNQVCSRNARLTAIRSFFHVVALRDPASIGVVNRVLAIPRKRTDKRLVGYLTREEIDAVLAAPDQSTWIGRRDYALLLTMYNSGARLSEMTCMRRGQVKFDSTTYLQLHGKGRKERVIPLWTKTGRVLRNWFRELELKATEVAFPSVRGTSLSSDGLDYILQQAVKRAAEACPSLLTKRVTPHLIRHYVPFRTMSGNGVPLPICPGDSRSGRGKPQAIARHSLMSATDRSGRRGVGHRVCSDPAFHPAGMSWQALSPSWQVSLRDKFVWFQHVRGRATMRSQNDRRLLAEDPWPWCASSGGQ